MGDKVRAAGLIVFRVVEELQYLLLQASNGIHHWTPPKGHVDPGEDAMQTAIRETEEESGLSPCHYDVLKDFTITIEYTAWGKPKRVDYWLAHLKDPNTSVKLSDEHQDFKWLKAEDAISAVITHQNMVDVIQKSHDYLGKQEQYKHRN